MKHVQELERLQSRKDEAAADLATAFAAAKAEGYDTGTLRVVLKLRKMTPSQRQERRALEAIYLAALGMLEGDPLPDEARRRLDGTREQPPPPPPDQGADPRADSTKDGEPPAEPPRPAQPPLILKDPAEARQEGADAAVAGKRIYDNPYPAGDPCRAAWDEGWCGQKKSHGMETPQAYQRRTETPDKKGKDGEGQGQGGEGDPGNGAGDGAERGAA